MDVTATDPYPYRTSDKAWNHELVLPAMGPFLHGGSGKLLDLGCGNGALLADLDTSRYSVFGCDFSPSGICVAKQRNIGDFRVVDATTDLTAVYGPASFDVILSVEVIEHVIDPVTFLRNAYALLRPGGKILLTTPYNGWLKNVALALSNRLDHHLDPLWFGGHIKFWSRATLTRALHETGFHKVQFAGAGRIQYLWKSMILTAVK